MTKIGLSNYEKHEFCLLDKATGETIYHKNKSIDIENVIGIYFRDDINFLGLYSTKNGPVIFFKNKEYPIIRHLNITFEKDDKNRTFKIIDYNIEINYRESPYVDFDNWSAEIDVDLLYRIAKTFQDDEFYNLFTL